MDNILKCKICGGDIEITANENIGTCQYCGTTITLPKLDSDKKSRLFNRAHQYRLNCEFDKAYDAYQAITLEDETEAEAYWGMLLSEYGVEYVEDPKTRKMIPTCHRTSVKSVLNDSNYMLACQYAEPENRFMYQDEAELLDSLQKRIISISSKAEAYDVFICYKETDDESGERTVDSVLAQDIYEALSSKGVKVFFSRVTLEDKLGEDYEPYIFAALRSAKVMLMVTTSSEHSNAIWVKNEWSRFIGMMSEDSEKVLIPVYKDISPYELPAEFAKYQAQDMSKVGAVQDLCRGVKKLVGGKVDDKDAVIKELLEDKEKRENQNKKNKIIFAVSVLVILSLVGIFTFSEGASYFKYKKAQQAVSERNYDYAKSLLVEIRDYKDSAEVIDIIDVIGDKKLGKVERSQFDYIVECAEKGIDTADTIITIEREPILSQAQECFDNGELKKCIKYREQLPTVLTDEDEVLFQEAWNQFLVGGEWKANLQNLMFELSGGELLASDKDVWADGYQSMECYYEQGSYYVFPNAAYLGNTDIKYKIELSDEKDSIVLVNGKQKLSFKHQK